MQIKDIFYKESIKKQNHLNNIHQIYSGYIEAKRNFILTTQGKKIKAIFTYFINNRFLFQKENNNSTTGIKKNEQQQ